MTERGKQAQPSDNCSRCGHLFDPHILVAYDNDDPAGGGLMFCQELRTCDCVRTWDVPQSGRPRRNVMPPAHVVAEWREALRGQLQAGS